MKFFKTMAATACALAVAAAAHAATYTDSSANYPDGWSTGSNGNPEGFNPWSIESHSTGDGWAGCGIWDPSANEFQGTWAGKTSAFGLMGKGQDCGVSATRTFRAPLAVGDSFSLDMAVNWDSDSFGALKGFALSVISDGGNSVHDILGVNHGDNPGHIYINGDDSSEVLNAYGTYPIKWTFIAKDATTLTVKANSRADDTILYEQDWSVSTSAINGFRLQSSEQRNENEDRRQSYYDNFTLEIAAELPDLVDLNFESGDWNVTNASQNVEYTLSRSSTVGDLTVNVKSSYEAFIPSFTISFADGESTATGSTTATLQPYAFNQADLTATATGCNPAVFENVRGPKFDREVKDGKWEFYPNDEPATFWMHWYYDGFDVDLSKVSLSCEPEGAVVLPDSLAWNPVDEVGEDGVKAWLESSFTAVSSGKILFQYDGVTFDDWDVTVLAPEIKIEGPTSAKTGSTATYTVSGTLIDGEVTVEITGDASAEPSVFELYTGSDVEVEVTFGDTAGTVTIAVSDGNDNDASIDVTVTAPVDPSDFSDYIAYDDASLYDDGFDASSTGAGQEGFQPWTIWKADAQYGSAIVTDADGGFPAILSDSSALAIYANGENPAYAIVRPFVNDLQPGQKASIEFVAPQEGGYRKIYFSRIWEGTPYNRFQVWASGGKVGVTVEDGDDTELSWSENSRRIVASVEFAADGSSYTLSLAGYNEGSEFVDDVFQYSIDTSVGSWGDGIQGIAIDGWDLPNDFIFNRLAIEQVEEPVVERKIGWGEGVYNPEGDGTYSITLTATSDDIGEVAISVEPSDGALSLESGTIDLTGVTSATITYTLAGASDGDSFSISAVPVDTTVAPLEGEGAYNVSVISPYLTLWCDDGGDFTTDTEEIWLSLSASPSKYGTYSLASSDPSVIELSVDSLTLPTVEGSGTAWFNVFVKGAGDAKITIEGEDANWEFHVSQGSDPSAQILPVTAMAIESGSMILTVDGQAGTVYGATEIKDGAWDWKAMELAVEGDTVAIPMGDSFMVIKVEK